MRTNDPHLPTIFPMATALRAGLTRQQVARRVRAGHWRRLRAGVYCRRSDWDTADRSHRHLMEAAAVTASGGPWVLSHASAAAAHGLPLPFGPTPVWLTQRPPGSTRYLDGSRLLVAGLGPGDVVLASIGRLTSRDPTVADCLRHLSTTDAVAVGDAALRDDPNLGPHIEAVLARCAGWPYVERARERLALLDGRRESPLESASAVEMRRGAVPPPEPQCRMYDERGLVARADFWWEEFAVVGEADGLTKYDVAPGAGADAAREILRAEKRREDRLRAMDARVVRWGWSELRSPGWARWLLRELERGEPSRFRGRIERTPAPPTGHYAPR